MNELDQARFLSPVIDVVHDVAGTLDAYKQQDLRARKVVSAPVQVRKGLKLLQGIASRAPSDSTCSVASSAASTSVASSAGSQIGPELSPILHRHSAVQVFLRPGRWANAQTNSVAK